MEYSHTTPFFNTELNTSTTVGILVWCAGPITGFFAQPAIGAMSDRLGRRKPFVMAGAVLTAAASVTFSLAETIAGEQSVGAVIIAMISFWVMDISINIVMVTLRLLISDAAASSPELQQQQQQTQATAQTIASLFQGAGQVTGMLINSLFSDPLGRLWVLYTIASCCLLVTCAVAVFAVHETPHRIQTVGGKPLCSRVVGGARGVISVLWTEVCRPPFRMLRILLAQFFTWLAWFSITIILTTWFAESFFAGNGDKGDSAGSMAFLYQAVVQLVSSLLLTICLARITGRRTVPFVWALTLAPLSACCTAMFATVQASRDPPPVWVAQLLWGLTGVATASTNIFPFAAVGNIYHDHHDKGLLMGLLNVSIVLPQLLDTLALGPFQKAVGINWCLLLAACFGAGACVFSLFASAPAAPPPSNGPTKL
eukprot:TRINITY_DN3569_c0_g2_i2.p1 TRINITY_DN3569_c0_g2~~TRINITY_DN3569_c0_g2_i2.p1  ORF type:complete len:426 (-),score=75.56 TRINITY_DN3569_c0_g2_i2:51-1328(-)